jgi:hypothetical protein
MEGDPEANEILVVGEKGRGYRKRGYPLCDWTYIIPDAEREENLRLRDNPHIYSRM